jgi:hypothetical protein
MDWSQLLFLALLLAATLTGSRLIAGVMWLNFAATVVLASSPITVAGADALAAALLLFCGKRGQIIAAIYAVMIPIYPVAVWAGLPNAATYTIVDLLAFIQLAALGGWDHGIGGGCRFVFRGRSVILDPVETRHHASHGLAISSAKGERS